MIIGCPPCDVCCASCTVSNCFKGHLLLNYWLDFDQTWQELYLMAFFDKCSNCLCPFHIKVSQAKIDFRDENFEIL